MANPSKEHTSIRVHAPPGGQSNNIFGQSEFEQSAANKKKHMESDIFGSKKESTDQAPVNRQTRNTGSNIFGTDPEENHPKGGTIAGQFKQTQMKSNIFGTDEPTSNRNFSDKNKSNIFGIGDDPNKRAAGNRRVGYNPINGEAYAPKENVTDKQPNSTGKPLEEENANAQAAPTVATENDSNSAQTAPTNTKENGNAQKPETTASGNNAQKPDNTANENNAQKNVHTSVRVFHPPGGRSNGPLW